MKKALWLLLLLPAVFAALWAYVTARPNDEPFQAHLQLKLHEESAEEPLFQAIRTAEATAKDRYWDMAGRRLSAWRKLESADLETLRQAFEAEGIYCDPDWSIQFYRNPAPITHRLLIFNSLQGHHDLATWLEQLSPSIMHDLGTTNQFMRVWRTFFLGVEFSLLESRRWTLDADQPRSELHTHVGLNGVPWDRVVLLQFPGFTLTNLSLSYQGPFWILAFLVMAIPALLIYFLRRPFLRILPARLRPICVHPRTS